MSELIGSLISPLTSQGSSLEIHQARVRLWGTGKNHTHALPNCRRRISLCIGVRIGRNRSAGAQAVYPPFCTRDFARRHRAPAFAVVYRTQYLQAVPGQCCTCRWASHLPWLPHGVPGALLDLRSHRCLRRRCVLIATIVRLEAAANAKPKFARRVERSSRGARRSVARADVRPTRCREDLHRDGEQAQSISPSRLHWAA
jgi:hypothetical protein